MVKIVHEGDGLTVHQRYAAHWAGHFERSRRERLYQPGYTRADANRYLQWAYRMMVRDNNERRRG